MIVPILGPLRLVVNKAGPISLQPSSLWRMMQILQETP